MTLGLLITVALVIIIIIVATKVKDQGSRIARLEQGSPTGDVTTAETGSPTPPESSETSERG